MHLDATLLTFSSTCSWCYALGFLQCHFEQGLDASWCYWISHAASNTLLMHLGATLLTFSSTRSWCYALGFLQCHFEQGLDASWCYALNFLMKLPTQSWWILMLRSWLSHQHALDATPLAFSNVTLNKVLMHLDAMLLNFSCSFQHTLDALLTFSSTRSWCYALGFLQCHFEQGLDASWCYALNFLM